MLLQKIQITTQQIGDPLPMASSSLLRNFDESQIERVQRLDQAFELFFQSEFDPDWWDLFDLRYATSFQAKVLRACFEIPPGKTSTYQGLAQEVGSPLAARAVGSVMSSNRFPLLIPCHRVTGSCKGNLGGYSAPGGLDTKRWLLAMESKACEIGTVRGDC